MIKKKIFAAAAIVLLIAAAAFALYRVRYRENEVIIRTGEKEIYGVLFQPRFSGREYPLVVLGHGYGGSYSDNLDYGRYFAENGIGCYVFDFCGGSEDSRSTRVQMSLDTEIEDMNDIVDYMLLQSWLKKDGLFLAGKSLGGCVAALTAADRPEDVGGLMLHYPFFMVSAAFLNEGEEPRPVVPGIFEEISRFRGPVLIFNGDQDKYVPAAYSAQAAEAYEDARLVILEGSGHGFGGKNREQVKNEMVRFIEERGEFSWKK